MSLSNTEETNRNNPPEPPRTAEILLFDGTKVIWYNAKSARNRAVFK